MDIACLTRVAQVQVAKMLYQFNKGNRWWEKGKPTAGVHGSVPKLLTASDAVRSHARCMYRPPGMSGHTVTGQGEITKGREGGRSGGPKTCKKWACLVHLALNRSRGESGLEHQYQKQGRSRGPQCKKPYSGVPRASILRDLGAQG
jgi:hypothetical protein